MKLTNDHIRIADHPGTDYDINRLSPSEAQGMEDELKKHGLVPGDDYIISPANLWLSYMADDVWVQELFHRLGVFADEYEPDEDEIASREAYFDRSAPFWT